MALTHDCTLADVPSFLEMLDLCSLDATSRYMSEELVNGDGKPHAWLAAALQAGLNLVAVDKSSIKAVFGAAHNHDIRVRPQTMSLNSKGAQELVKVAEHMKNKRSKLMQLGAQAVETFIVHLDFGSEAIKSYLADPKASVSSLPIPISMGDTTMNFSLTWRGAAASLVVEAPSDVPLKPFGIQLHTVSSSIVMRMSFDVENLYGSGLCHFMQTPKAFAKTMEEGILCVGLVHSLPAGTRVCGASPVNALMLDLACGAKPVKPDWRRLFLAAQM